VAKIDRGIALQNPKRHEVLLVCKNVLAILFLVDAPDAGD
jgi:hypothetical protein